VLVFGAAPSKPRSRPGPHRLGSAIRSEGGSRCGALGNFYLALWPHRRVRTVLNASLFLKVRVAMTVQWGERGVEAPR
jgi:hypothetical protein